MLTSNILCKEQAAHMTQRFNANILCKEQAAHMTQRFNANIQCKEQAAHMTQRCIASISQAAHLDRSIPLRPGVPQVDHAQHRGPNRQPLDKAEVVDQRVDVTGHQHQNGHASLQNRHNAPKCP